MVVKNNELYATYPLLAAFPEDGEARDRWYRRYVLKEKEEEDEEENYARAVHYVLEMFFRSNKTMSRRFLAECWNEYIEKNMFTYTAFDKMAKSGIDLMKTLDFVCNLGKRQDTPIGSLFKRGAVVAVNETFSLKFDMELPAFLENATFEHVNILGRIDLLMEYKGDLYAVDHICDMEKKDDDDLFACICAMHIKKSRKKPPKKFYRFYTRLLDWQCVEIDEEKIKKACERLNAIFNSIQDYRELEDVKHILPNLKNGDERKD